MEIVYEFLAGEAYFYNQHKTLSSKCELVNLLIKKHNFIDYLAIGVDEGKNINDVECLNKTCIDKNDNYLVTYNMSSDEYFKEKGKDKLFDIILIDGIHTYEDCYNDIVNSLNHLKPNGIIVCHDMNPVFEDYETGDNDYHMYNGNVWKSFVRIRSERDDIESCLICNFDYGIGLIKFGKSNPIVLNKPIEEYTFYDFSLNKKYLMNSITLKQFKDKYLKIYLDEI